MIEIHRISVVVYPQFMMRELSGADIDAATQARLRAAAMWRQVSPSRFVAELVRRATGANWPDELLALAGSAPAFPRAGALRLQAADDTARLAW